jgi:hypothetical protein
VEATRLVWTLAIGKADQPSPSNGDWTQVVRSAATAEWGTITARRGDSNARLSLRFNRDCGVLEHSASDDGPVSGARFPNRRPIADEEVELPCCGCEIPLNVPDGFVLRKADAVRLFLQYLHSGELPRNVTEPQPSLHQPLLPGMEAFIVPDAVLNAVDWELL